MNYLLPKVLMEFCNSGGFFSFYWFIASLDIQLGLHASDARQKEMLSMWQYTVENGKVTIHSGNGKVTIHMYEAINNKVNKNSRVVNMSTWIYHSLVIKVNVNNQRKCSFWQFSPTTVTRGIKVPCQHHSFTGQEKFKRDRVWWHFYHFNSF